jgi:hypothetical protein
LGVAARAYEYQNQGDSTPTAVGKATVDGGVGAAGAWGAAAGCATVTGAQTVGIRALACGMGALLSRPGPGMPQWTDEFHDEAGAIRRRTLNRLPRRDYRSRQDLANPTRKSPQRISQCAATHLARQRCHVAGGRTFAPLCCRVSFGARHFRVRSTIS